MRTTICEAGISEVMCTMLYLFSKYDAFVFGSKKKLYQKCIAHVIKIKALSTFMTLKFFDILKIKALSTFMTLKVFDILKIKAFFTFLKLKVFDIVFKLT